MSLLHFLCAKSLLITNHYLLFSDFGSTKKLSTHHGSDALLSNIKKNGNKRRFVKYTSSDWESLWLENIAEWESNQTVCQNVLSPQQREYLKEFQQAICSHIIEDLWCAVIDPPQSSPYMYNLQTGVYQSFDAAMLRHFKPAQPVVPLDNGEGQIPKVFSRMDFLDETTGETFSEFIEPLVSHLRHPVAGCVSDEVPGDLTWPLVLSRSFIVPIPPSSASLFSKAYYFDAGASSWTEGAGGPSLDYFTRVFARHEIDFDHIEAYEGSVSADDFYASVPDNYKNRTFYNQVFIASSPSMDGPFIPFVISNITQKEDYVFFKLDIDSGDVERGTVDYMLSDDTDSLQYIKEFVWEHHVAGNYIMAPFWGGNMDNLSIYDSYQYFLKLRRLGVRAHSYV